MTHQVNMNQALGRRRGQGTWKLEMTVDTVTSLCNGPCHQKWTKEGKGGNCEGEFHDDERKAGHRKAEEKVTL